MIAPSKKLTRLGILISLCLSCSSALAIEKFTLGTCGYNAAHHGTVFTLQIQRAFHRAIEFKLCAREEPDRSFLLVTRDSEERNKTDDPIKIPLNYATYQKLLTLYHDALDYDVRDKAGGLDGSTWCLETGWEFTYSKACFWSPESRSEDRRLIGLLKLGQELWRIGGIDPRDGSLY